MDDCFIGTSLDDKCHHTKFTKKLKLKTGLQNIKDLSADERTLIFWRSGVPLSDDFKSTDFSICFHHKILFLQYFSQKFKNC